MNPIIFEIQNFIPISIIFLLTTITIYKNYKSKNFYQFWSPLTFISLIYIYYTIVGAITILSSSDYTYLGVDLSGSATYAWVGASLSLLSIHTGFIIYKGSRKPLWNYRINIRSFYKVGMILFLIGFVIYSIFRGFNLSVFQSSIENEFEDGGFAHYFINCISFLVLSSLLMIPSIFTKRFSFFKFIPIIITVIVFLIGGFRYRLVFLVISCSTMFYIYTKKRIKPLFWMIFTVLFIIFMGIIEVSRGYNQGLDLSKTEGMEVSDVLSSAFNEANTFFVSGKVIQNTIETGKFIYFEPIATALFMPIPRQIFPNKPDGNYLNEIQIDIFKTAEHGAAFLNYAEAFFAFGWFGLIIHGFLIGFLAKLFWINFLRNKENIMVIASLALFNGFLYIMISRGYFATHVIFFIYYIVFPIWISKTIYKLIYKFT